MDAYSITLDSSIEQVLAARPALIAVFLAYRLACVGCPMAQFCTLEDALVTYRIPREQFVAGLRDAAGSQAARSV